jgi:hypothetical protein
MAGKSVAENLLKVKARIAAAVAQSGRDAATVRLLAVSKLHPEIRIREANAAGQEDFGENYIQEAAEKKTGLQDLHLRWHFIGHLQTNKARAAAEADFALIHSVDSLRLAQKISAAGLELGRAQNILLQVNVAGEASKSGVAEDGFDALIDSALELKGLRLHGLMTMPPLGEKPEVTRGHFAKLRQLLEKAQAKRGTADKLTHPLDQLSMGTSSDFQEAIAEGATWIRIGTDIFGERK